MFKFYKAREAAEINLENNYQDRDEEVPVLNFEKNYIDNLCQSRQKFDDSSR